MNNLCETIRQNILNQKLDSNNLKSFTLGMSNEKINEIYTKEKEKYGQYFKLVKLKSGKFAFYFSDERLLAVPENMSEYELKELYCVISKEDLEKEMETILKEI